MTKWLSKLFTPIQPIIWLASLIAIAAIVIILESHYNISLRTVTLYQSVYQVFKVSFPHFYLIAYLSVFILPQAFLLFFCTQWVAITYTVFINGIVNKNNWFVYRLHIVLIKILPARPHSYEQGLIRHLLAMLAYLAVFLLIYLYQMLSLPAESFYKAQLVLSHVFVVVIYLHIFLVFLRHYKQVLPFFRTFFSAKASPFFLAVFRVIFFILLILMYGYQYQSAELMRTGNFQVVGVPYGSWCIPLMPFNWSAYLCIYYMGIGCCIISALGFLYKYVAWLNIFFAFYLIGAPMMLGVMCCVHIFFWVTCFLAFVPASEVLSVDHVIKKITNKPVDAQPNIQYGVVFSLIWLHLGIVYFFPGISKIWDTGFYWALGPSMINQIHLEWLQHYYHIPAFRPDHYVLLTHFLGLCAMLTEISALFIMLSARFRPVAVLLLFGMHTFAGSVMYLPFPDLEFFSIAALLSGYVGLIGSKKTSKKPDEQLVFTKATKGLIALGLLFFCMNTICGFFEVKTWPFSIYPKHSANVNATFTRIEFEIPEMGWDRFKIDSIADKNKFDKNHFYDLSDEVIFAYNDKDTVKSSKFIKLLWHNWQIGSVELSLYDHPKAFIIETPVAPEKRAIVLRREEIVY